MCFTKIKEVIPCSSDVQKSKQISKVSTEIMSCKCFRTQCRHIP
nr:MAG TPA: hypothetical protein [Caudoviricetes sp.]